MKNPSHRYCLLCFSAVLPMVTSTTSPGSSTSLVTPSVSSTPTDKTGKNVTGVTLSCLIILFSFDVAPVSAGVIAGAVFAVVAVVLIILIVMLIVCFLKYRNKGESVCCES